MYGLAGSLKQVVALLPLAIPSNLVSTNTIMLEILVRIKLSLLVSYEALKILSDIYLCILDLRFL